ncbi:MAG: citrate lyase subunit beta [Anaerolineaceae bacterium]|nr:citrate lyase subunit beta [Anaerolineaceae bacterium]
MRSRRALLYVPADDLHKINKAANLSVDSIILDLEDATATNRKQEARQISANVLQTIQFGDSERLVRVNPFFSGLTEADLEAILPAKPDGIILPKVINAADVQTLSSIIQSAEQKNGWQIGSIPIIAVVESALGIIQLPQICQADARLQAIICGGEDLAADLNAIRTRSAKELFYARSAVVLHAAAYKLQAIDMVTADFTDLDFLVEEARSGMEMGFSGKQIIHPNQVEPVQKAFTPEEDEIRYAQELIRQFNENQSNGQGAFAIDGAMVDMPMITRAKNLLARANITTE